MKIELIYFVVFWLNASPSKAGVSRKYSPRELILRLKVDYKKHCKVLFGSYYEVHHEPEPSNSMKPRTHPAIALGPSGNLQGTVKFHSLYTGCVLRRQPFILIPMPQTIINKVNRIGKRESQGKEFSFANRQKVPFEWSDDVPIDDPSFQGLLEPDTPYPDIPAKLPGVPVEDQEGPQPAMEEELEPDEDALAVLALENAGPGGERAPKADDPVEVREDHQVQDGAIPDEDQLDQEIGDEPQQAEDPNPLPPGVLVVEDLEDSNAEGPPDADDKESAGLPVDIEEEHRSTGVHGEPVVPQGEP